MVLHNSPASLLATHLPDSCSLLSILSFVLTKDHHGLNLVVEILEVGSHMEVSDSYGFYSGRAVNFAKKVATNRTLSLGRLSVNRNRFVF